MSEEQAPYEGEGGRKRQAKAAATKWRLVPSEPTDEMINGMEEMYMPLGEMIAAWDGAMMNAPDPIEDAELRKQVAQAIAYEFCADAEDWHRFKREADAAIAVMNGGRL